MKNGTFSTDPRESEVRKGSPEPAPVLALHEKMPNCINSRALVLGRRELNCSFYAALLLGLFDFCFLNTVKNTVKRQTIAI